MNPGGFGEESESGLFGSGEATPRGALNIYIYIYINKYTRIYVYMYDDL